MNYVEVLASKSWYWWINETGIALEIIGAALIVLAAFRTRRQIKDIADGWDSNLAVKLRDVVSNQAITELKGFGLLAVGLFGQMIGGFNG